MSNKDTVAFMVMALALSGGDSARTDFSKQPCGASKYRRHQGAKEKAKAKRRASLG